MSMKAEDSLSVDDPRFRITPLQQIAASSTGAFLTSLIMTPFDVVKIRLQAQQKASLSNKCFIYCNGLMDHLCPCLNGSNNSLNGHWYRRPSHFTGTLDAFVKISRQEGVTSLWSGLSPTLVLAIPATVIYFVAYEQLRVRIKDYYNQNYNADGSKSVQPSWIPLLSGATARVWAATVVSPLELVRTKMQSQKLSYFEIGQAVRSLLRDEGILGLWKGLSPTLLRDVPFSAIYWINYEGLKSAFSQENPNLGFSFLAGAFSGSIASVLTLPFDVVKTHLQIEMGEKEIYTDSPRHPRRSTTLQIMKRIYNAHGIKGLFAGIVPRVLKVAPACAVMVMSFEYGKSFFQLHNRRNYIESLKDDTWDLMEKKTNNVNANSLR